MRSLVHGRRVVPLHWEKIEGAKNPHGHGLLSASHVEKTVQKDSSTTSSGYGTSSVQDSLFRSCFKSCM
jgi:hypothetical protein